MQHTDEYKDQFYTALKAEISTVPTKDKLIILGDFNARVGTDWTTWAGVLGKHGVGKCNSNGELLLETCMSHSLTITNTYFQLPLRNRTSWMHPRSKHWHLIDYVLVRQQDRQDVRVTKSMCGADCWTDHRLIVSKLKLVIQPQKRPQGLKAPKKMDPARIADPVVKATLMTQLSEIMKDQTVDPENIGGSWTHFTDSVHKVSMETVGAPSRVHQDWFDDQNADIQQLIDQKHQLFRSHLSDPSSSSKKDAYQCAKRTCQRELRQMQNQWFSQKAKDIETHATTNNSKEFYKTLQAVYGRRPAASSSSLLDSKGENLITDPEEILERWAEHFDGVLNRPSTMNDEAINRLPQIEVNMALDLIPTLEEVNKAIKSLSKEKAPGADAIPAEIFSEGGPDLVDKLLEFFQAMWTREELYHNL